MGTKNLQMEKIVQYLQKYSYILLPQVDFNMYYHKKFHVYFKIVLSNEYNVCNILSKSANPNNAYASGNALKTYK